MRLDAASGGDALHGRAVEVEAGDGAVVLLDVSGALLAVATCEGGVARFRHMVDLGGATGHLAIAACERYPDLRAVVFDLPQVIETARAHARRSLAANVLK